MKLTRTLTLGAAVLGLALSASAQNRCGALNSRPVPLGFEFGTGLNIQNMIDAHVWAGPTIKAASAQTSYAVFRPGQDLTVAFTFMDGRFFGTSNLLGLYEASDPSNKFPVFAGENLLPGDQVVVTFFRNGDVLRNGQLVATNFSSCFGIYMDVYGGTPLSGGSGNPRVLDWVHHSEDSLNLNGDAQMVIYKGRNTTILQTGNLDPWLFANDEFLVGVEVQPIDPAGFLPADADYNECVFVMHGVTTFRRPVGVGF